MCPQTRDYSNASSGNQKEAPVLTMNPFNLDFSSPRQIDDGGSSRETMREHRPCRGRTRTASWSKESDMTTKNRKLINSHLRRMSDIVGKDASLDQSGMCHFQFRRFVVSLDVPVVEDQASCFRLYTMVFRIEKGDNRNVLMKKCMKLNYNGVHTRGACLGLEGNEISLFRESPVTGLTRDRLARCLQDFMQTILEVNQELEALKRH